MSPMNQRSIPIAGRPREGTITIAKIFVRKRRLGIMDQLRTGSKHNLNHIDTAQWQHHIISLFTTMTIFTSYILTGYSVGISLKMT